MRTITITYPDGKKITNEISEEKARSIESFIKKSRERKEKLMEETFTKVPPIHWEILRYHNHHTKDETIAAYPEYKEFIGTIR